VGPTPAPGSIGWNTNATHTSPPGGAIPSWKRSKPAVAGR
jgi:hypothetical protein